MHAPRTRPTTTLVQLGLLLLATASGGCFIEGSGGYYMASASGPDGNSGADPDISGGLGWGVAVGVAGEFDRSVRVAGGYSGQYINAKLGDAEDGNITRGALGVQVDVSVHDLDDDTKVRASLEAMVTGAGRTSGKLDGEEFNTSHKTWSVFAGPSVAFFDDDDGSVMASLGAHYISMAARTSSVNPDLTMYGPQLKLTISGFNIFGGSEGSSSDSGGSNAGIKFELPNDTNVMPALAHAARQAGCSVDEGSAAVLAKCSGGNNIAYVQKGRTLVAVCRDTMSHAECNTLHKEILSHAEVGN